MPLSPHRKVALFLVITFVSFGIVVFGWRNTSNVGGEIFLVTENGKSIVVPGASIQLLKVSDAQASAIRSDLGKKFEAYVNEEGKYTSMLPTSPDELTTAYVESMNKLSARKYCWQLQLVGGDTTHAEYIWGNADRNGRFSLAVTPGTYFLHVIGQGGETHAEWAQIIRVQWREQLRLVQPTCSYSQ
jgi:hypothetical protein